MASKATPPLSQKSNAVTTRSQRHIFLMRSGGHSENGKVEVSGRRLMVELGIVKGGIVEEEKKEEYEKLIEKFKRKLDQEKNRSRLYMF